MFGNPGPSIGCACCYWGVMASRPTQLIERGKVCGLLCVNVGLCHVSLSSVIYLHITYLLLKHELTLMLLMKGCILFFFF